MENSYHVSVYLCEATHGLPYHVIATVINPHCAVNLKKVFVKDGKDHLQMSAFSMQRPENMNGCIRTRCIRQTNRDGGVKTEFSKSSNEQVTFSFF